MKLIYLAQHCGKFYRKKPTGQVLLQRKTAADNRKILRAVKKKTQPLTITDITTSLRVDNITICSSKKTYCSGITEIHTSYIPRQDWNYACLDQMFNKLMKPKFFKVKVKDRLKNICDSNLIKYEGTNKMLWACSVWQ